MYILHPAIITDKGRRRQENEDSVGYVYPDQPHILNDYGALFVIADGVGGASHGAECSQAIVQSLKTLYYQNSGTVQQRLLTAIRQINRELYQRFHGTASSTMTAVVVKGDRVVLAHVGDSVAYWLKKGSIQKLTNDHVLQVDPSDPRKTKLTRAMGYKETVEIDTSSIGIQPGGRILLFTDGVTRYLKEDLLYDMCRTDAPDIVARNIVNAANAAGGKDNITAAVIAIGEPIPPGFNLPQHIGSLPIDLNATPMPRQQAQPTPPAQPSAMPATVYNPPAKRSSGRWLIAVVLLAVIIGGGALVILGSSGDDPATEPTSTVMEIEPTEPAEIASTVIPTSTDTPPTLTFTPEPTEDTFNAPLAEGDQVIFEDTALTFARLGEDTASFAIAPGTTYRIEEIYTARDETIWVRLYDIEEEEDGWIEQDDLPDYRILR